MCRILCAKLEYFGACQGTNLMIDGKPLPLELTVLGFSVNQP
jgi:hypothetical protein